MPKNLENRIHDAMVLQYEKAKEETGYSFRGFKNMIDKYGGVIVAKKLVENSIPSDGFLKLCKPNNLRLTAEFLVIQDEREELFTVEEKNMAAKKLKDYHFNFEDTKK